MHEDGRVTFHHTADADLLPIVQETLADADGVVVERNGGMLALYDEDDYPR